MSRRTRKPGPLKESAYSTNQRFRTQVSNTNPWITINCFTSGALPTDVSTLSGSDINNGSTGTWYFYDPNSTIDFTANSNVWLTQDSNGVQFEGVNLAKVDDSGNKLEWANANSCQAGRIATALRHPVTGEELTFGDLAGGSVEFLIERTEDCPHNENHEVGIFACIAPSTIMSSTDNNCYGLGSCYFGTASSNPEGTNTYLFNAQAKAQSTSADGRKHYGMHTFANNSASLVLAGYSTGRLFDSNDHQHHNTSSAAQQKSTRRQDPANFVYLVVGPFARDNSGSGSAVRRTGKFRLWFRVNLDSKQFAPDYVLQGDNHFSGASSGIR